MTANKNRHLHDELYLIFSGHKSELSTSSVAIAHLRASEAELTELERLAEIGRLTEKLLETGSMQHRFKYLDDIRSVEQLIEWGGITMNRLVEIYDHFGAKAQAMKLVEEAHELGEAVLEGDIEHIHEEWADCMVLMNQIYSKYGLDMHKIHDIMAAKEKRTLERIGTGHYDNGDK